MGDDARRDEARRRRHPGDHAARRPTTCATGSSAGEVAARDRPAARHAAKFDAVDGDYTRIAVGAPADRLDSSTTTPTPRRRTSRRTAPTRATDPLLLYFTSGTTAQPKLVLHTHQSYPVGHLSTMYWLGLQPGDVHLNISSPGWAKHAWSCFFAPWNAEAHASSSTTTRASTPPALLDALERCGVTTLCAPPTVWRHADPGGPRRASRTPALRELVGAGEPLNPEVIEQVRAAWGLTIRDGYGQTETTRADRQLARASRVKPGSMGRPLPGYRVALLDRSTGSEADEGEICLDLVARARSG